MSSSGKRILIMGLNNTGKTTFAKLLQIQLHCPYFNADDVRQQFMDYDFSEEGRWRQAVRMQTLCDMALIWNDYAIADFICPTTKTRNLFNPNYTIWIDTLKKSVYPDTNALFQPPSYYDYRITRKHSFEKHARVIAAVLKKGESNTVSTIKPYRLPVSILKGGAEGTHPAYKKDFIRNIREKK